MGRGAFRLGIAVLGALAGFASAHAACKVDRYAQFAATFKGAAPVISAKINGADTSLEADSGAFFSTLSPAAVEKFGLKTRAAPNGMRLRGVGGIADVKVTTVEQFGVAGSNLSHVDFLVADGIGRNDGLLGQNILGTQDAEYDLANGVIRLFKPEGCQKTVMAYWAEGKPYSVIDIDTIRFASFHIRGVAKVNGATVHVIFDTGSWRSILTTGAAARAGLKRTNPGVTAGGYVNGIGHRTVDSWIAPVQSFAIGDETTSQTRLRVGDIELNEADMLLGVDFFLSHRIYVSNSQHKLYFTYNGGNEFQLDRTDAKPDDAPAALDAAAPTPSTSAAAASDPQDADAPTDAAGFDRRASAWAARGELARAIADYGRAIELEPNEARHYAGRGLARLTNGQRDLALADFDHALKLKPDDFDTLMARGSMRLERHDEAGARADLDAAARLNPTAQLTIAEYYSREGMFEAAITQLDAWTKAHPKDPRMAMALNARCWARALWNRDLDAAMEDCNAALKLLPRNPAILDSRGLVRLRQGLFKEAIADYDAVLKKEPKVAWSLYGRGLAEIRTGDKATGKADLQAATALAPKLPEEAKRRGLTEDLAAKPGA